MEETKGGVVLPDQSTGEKLYGRIISIGPEVEDKTLQPGDIAVFDANGVRDVRLSRLEDSMFVAISQMMLYCTVSEEYVESLGLPIPEVTDAEGLREDQEVSPQEEPVDASQGGEEAGSQDHNREAKEGRAATA
jgi:hypothetical protein